MQHNGKIMPVSLTDISVYVCDEGELSEMDAAGLRLMQIRTVNLDSATVQTTSRQITKQLPPDCPSWAAGLNDCEV